MDRITGRARLLADSRPVVPDVKETTKADSLQNKSPVAVIHNGHRGQPPVTYR